MKIGFKPIKIETLGAAAIFAVAAAMFLPTFYWGLACGHDTEAHFYRVAQLVLNIQNGHPFLMWSPDLLRGYGYPILGQYAPLSYWLIALLNLTGIHLSASFRVFIFITLFFCGWGGYHLGRRYLSTAGSFIVGLAYMFAPYLIYNSTERGAFPELLGLMLLPWVLASFDALQTRRSLQTFTRSVLLFTLLVLSHNVIPFLAVPTIGILWIARGWENGELRNHTINYIWPSLLVGVFAFVLTLFYWLPAIVELQVTHSRGEAGQTLHSWSYYGEHFIPLSEMVRMPDEPADSNLNNPPLTRTMGMGQAILAVVGMAALLWLDHRRKSLLGWVLIGTLAIFLATSASDFLWQARPLPTFIQLPSRLLGLSSLAAAILAGFAVDGLIKINTAFFSSRWRPIARWIIVFLCGLIVTVSGWPWLFPQYCSFPVNPDALGIVQATRWEESGRVISWGGAASGETLPVWTTALPPADQLFADYEADVPPQRLVIEDGMVLETWEPAIAGDVYQLQVEQPAVITYQALYFPGWQAWINGRSATINPSEPHGFMTVEIESGLSEVEFRFLPTPLRITTGVISLIALAGLLFLLGRGAIKGREVEATPQTDQSLSFVALLGITICFLLIRMAINLIDTPIRADRLVDGQLQMVDQSTNIPFDQEFMHLGYSGPAVVQRDEPFEVVQYWRPLDSIGVPYGFGLRVADDEGRVWSVEPELPSRPFTHTGFNSRIGWQTDQYLRDGYILSLIPGIPPGEYWLEAEAFQRHVAFALTPEFSQGVDPSKARIGKIVVESGRRERTVDWQINQNSPVEVNSALSLIGWSVPESIVWKPGDRFSVDLLWRSDQSLSDDLQGQLLVLDGAGDVLVDYPFSLGGESYGTSLWQRNRPIRDRLRWPLPPDLPSGSHPVVVEVDGRRVDLGRITAEAPDRLFEPPAVAQPADEWLQIATLLGYDLEFLDDGQSLLYLTWRVEEETSTPYRVFVHVRNAAGEMIAQADGVPAEWTRPTTGWLAREYLVDRYRLSLTAGEWEGTTINLGFYNPSTGERLAEVTLEEVNR
ncbi:MAG: 6-pyruvoyl-tetrahydropterin synthase-related protein [Ardenticatenaceae bacterium]|nr:6-pyruvoyl-tetrahydropterin synthase-related protein [Ardenticatenaceae bacterium]